MKQTLQKIWDETCSIEQSSELYVIFVRVIQALGLLGLLFQMGMLLFALRDEGFWAFVGPAFLLLPALFTVGLIALGQWILRAVPRGKFSGVWVGLLLSVLCFGSWYFPVGLFGLYCFLNPGFQRKHLRGAPAAFMDFLDMVNLNFTAAAAAAAAAVASVEAETAVAAGAVGSEAGGGIGVGEKPSA